MQKIPLKKNNNYFFSSTLNINNGSKTLYFRQLYNSVIGGWTLDIGDSNGTLISSLPLVPAAGNLLEQYKYLRIGSAWLIPTGNNADFPAWEDIESDWLLLWGDNDNE